jgi:hypothetical protein
VDGLREDGRPLETGSSAASYRYLRERAAAGRVPVPNSSARSASSAGLQSRQRGSHVRLKDPDRSVSLLVPLHRELKRGTLAGILRDAGIDREELRCLL